MPARDRKRKFELILITLVRPSSSVLRHRVCISTGFRVLSGTVVGRMTSLLVLGLSDKHKASGGRSLSKKTTGSPMGVPGNPQIWDT